MRVLLDTHILLAIIEQQLDRFTPGIRSLLVDPTGEFYVSVASLWEIAIKRRLGKLQLTPPLKALPSLLTSIGIELIAINEHHTLLAVEPEPLTRDPFDRLLLAQCQVEDLRLVTTDRALVAHPMAINS
ncbi:type II toxin-antitoxin system VapC family toxin [Phyllobacterium bourgognense]|uniref:PIN domain nuclease of toxin-antitoxin system n=1 Tax=Phyllobacterium bourgognense TaxID=314236 RepID=A0A368YY90_9HYPH|nr:type II toxin-antitoxin system VapC family toxin [Phyllobacterium bourgognense]RCW84528.1 PIN domain nuclease of toxin-antitoxin system [Phyllobacterium bourgognense]